MHTEVHYASGQRGCSMMSFVWHSFGFLIRYSVVYKKVEFGRVARAAEWARLESV